MGIFRLAAGALLAIALLSSLALASGFETTGLGWKARAMGGAFTAVADDWTAAYYNPAGYAWIKDNQVGGNSAFVHFRNSLDPNYVFGGIADSTGYFNGRQINNKFEILSNPSAGVLTRVPLCGETVIGFSIYELDDQNITWNLFRPLRAYNDSLDGLLPPKQFYNNLDVVAFQLTIAHELKKDKLSGGIGLQLLRGDLVYNTMTFRPNPIHDSIPSQSINYRPYDQIPEFSAQDGYGWGFGFRAGLLWKASNRVNVGVTAAVPFDITLKGNATLSFFMPYNRADLRTGSTIFPGTVNYLFVAGEKLDVNGDYSTTLRLPPSFSVGIAYNINDKLTLDLDAQYTMWSRFKGFDFNYSSLIASSRVMDSSSVKGFFNSNLSSPVKWSDAGRVALGGMYEVAKSVTLLAGAFYDGSADKDNAGVVPQMVDPGNKLGINAGVTVHVQQWDLGFSTSYTHYPDLTVSGLQDLNGDGMNDNVPGTYKAQTYESVFSVIYRF